MAEKDVNEKKTLEQLEKEITCAVCQEHYEEPKVLSCLHYYCKECVKKLAASTQTISCPECREKSKLPEGGVEELKTAFFVNRFQSHFSVLKRVLGKVEVKCEECTDSGNKAEAFCRQCAWFICKKCVESHKRMKSFASHQVVSLEELKQGTIREIAVKEPPTIKCPTHEEPLVIYCFDCNSLICRDCTVTVHKEHKFEFSKVAAPETKEKLLDHLNSLTTEAVAISGAVTDIQTVKHEVEAQGNSVADAINTSFEKLQILIDKCKERLLMEAECCVNEKVSQLSNQENSLSAATAKLQSFADYTKQFVSECSDNDVMSMHTDIKHSIDQTLKEHGKSWCDLVPVQEADIGVEVKCEEIQWSFSVNSMVTRLTIDQAKCTVRGEGVKKAEVTREAEVVLTTKFSNGEIVRHLAVVHGKLKSLCNESVIKCDVIPLGHGEYRIQYTPKEHGRHELALSVEGKQIEGSPFSVLVSIPPKLLYKPAKVWAEIKQPTGITTNTVGEVIVTEKHGDIVRIDSSGERRVLIEYSKTKLKQLSSIDTDSEGFIYCTDFICNRILRCDKDGGNVQVFVVQQMKGPGYNGVAVVGDKVMVCECNNTGTIRVFDRKINIMRRTIQYGTGEFCNISPDQKGNIYVTDITNGFIRVFNTDGNLIRSFDRNDKGDPMLNGPGGICVSGEYVYVANWGSDTVTVFTIEGDYVTSFGHCGDREGEFNSLRSICIDFNNFICIADCENNRIQCFEL